MSTEQEVRTVFELIHDRFKECLYEQLDNEDIKKEYEDSQ